MTALSCVYVLISVLVPFHYDFGVITGPNSLIQKAPIYLDASLPKSLHYRVDRVTPSGDTSRVGEDRLEYKEAIDAATVVPSVEEVEEVEVEAPLGNAWEVRWDSSPLLGHILLETTEGLYEHDGIVRNDLPFGWLLVPRDPIEGFAWQVYEGITRRVVAVSRIRCGGKLRRLVVIHESQSYMQSWTYWVDGMGPVKYVEKPLDPEWQFAGNLLVSSLVAVEPR